MFIVSSLPYSEFFGGVSGLTVEQFRKINGFSNAFWGWGGEDDDLWNRLVHWRADEWSPGNVCVLSGHSWRWGSHAQDAHTGKPIVAYSTCKPSSLTRLTSFQCRDLSPQLTRRWQTELAWCQGGLVTRHQYEFTVKTKSNFLSSNISFQKHGLEELQKEAVLISHPGHLRDGSCKTQ